MKYRARSKCRSRSSKWCMLSAPREACGLHVRHYRSGASTQMGHLLSYGQAAALRMSAADAGGFRRHRCSPMRPIILSHEFEKLNVGNQAHRHAMLMPMTVSKMPCFSAFGVDKISSVTSAMAGYKVVDAFTQWPA